MKFIISLDNRGALKRGFSVIAIVMFVFAVFMASYALSETSVYDKVSTGDYIDTGLDKTKGISMDFVEKGLTHKVLEFDIASEISSQDIQLLIAENNFDAKEGSLTKLNIVSKEEQVYEAICNPYNLEDPVNHSVNTVQNCTAIQTGTKTVYENQWLPVEMKAAEKADTASLSTFNILGKGKYRYSFDTPIIQTAGGWGNTGTVFLKVGSDLFADKQHSSWWNFDFPNRKAIQINASAEMIRKWYTAEVSGFDTTNNAKFNQTNPNNFAVVCDETEVDKLIGNTTDLKSSGNTMKYPASTGWGTTNTTFLFRILQNVTGINNTLCYIYYGGSLDYSSTMNNKSNIALFYDDFDRADSATVGERWVENEGQDGGTIKNNRFLCPSATCHMVSTLDTGNCSDCERYSIETTYSQSGNDNGCNWGGFLDTSEFCGYGRCAGSKGVAIASYPNAKGGKNIYAADNILDTSFKRTTLGTDISLSTNYTFKVEAIDDSVGEYYNMYQDGSRATWATTNGTSAQTGFKTTVKFIEYNGWTGNTYMDYLYITRYMANLPTIVLGSEETSNTAPAVNISTILPTTAYTNDDLNCSFTVTDAEQTELTANVSWYKDEILHFSFVIPVSSGASASNMLHNLNTTKGETWNCSVIAYDGELYSNVSSTVRVVSNSEPVIDSYNVSSLNRTDVEYTANVTYRENETIRFAIEITDADNDEVWYSWFVDSIFQTLTQSSWFDYAWGWLSSDLHTVRVDVNDSDNAITTQAWNVDIANVPNIFWTIGFVFPTPADEEILSSDAVNISVQITPRVAVEGESAEIFNNATDFTGTFENTQLNATSKAIQLTYPQTTGSYTSPVYDAGEAIVWDNIRWSEFIPTDGELEAQSGLVGAWHMNEGTGDIMDSSGEGNNGAAYGNVVYGVNGTFSTALQFAEEGYVTLPDANSLDLTNNLTIQAWIKTSTPNRGILFKGVDGTYGDYAIGLNSVGRMTLYFRNVLVATGTGSSLANNNWHHVAATYNGINVKLYVDGTLQTTNAYTNTLNQSMEPLRIGYYHDTAARNFDGVIDEVGIWNYALNSTQVLKQYNAKLVNLTFQVKMCDDASCVGESFTGPLGASSYYSGESGETLNTANNRYLQYKAFFETNKANLTASLYNVTFAAHTEPVYENVSITNVWLSMNGANTSMSGSGYNWNYVNSSLLVGSYTYKVYANDSYGNVNVTETRSFSVPSYNITFNVTSGEDGSVKNNVVITCDYSGFGQGGDTTNMYGSYAFPVGSWSCTFELAGFYSKTKIFTADADKAINVGIEEEFSLTNQEHDWLASLYNCVITGDCTAYNLLQTINRTTAKIWQQYLPTDENVVLQEDTLSSVLTATNDISINYTIAVPYKESYAIDASLPIMISFWFTGAEGKCYNQDKQTDGNRAESPYCIPLIAEYLGPNNGTISFKVDLHPNLADGTYNIVRSIDIDPPVNGKPVWINHGRDIIGTITANNAVKSSESIEPATVDGKVPPSPSLNPITGMAVSDANNVNISLAKSTLIGLAMMCITILGMAYLRKKP
ncbi:MAG: LamG domain-containing protein [Candidatus Nanoarchaeia archaeon]|jgi:hypothetical protein